MEKAECLKDNLSDTEKKWMHRLAKYMNDFGVDYVCSWWLRIEYGSEGITTPKINYILSKLVDKGILKKETSKSWTKFSVK
jgi:hypothetical protein